MTAKPALQSEFHRMQQLLVLINYTTLNFIMLNVRVREYKQAIYSAKKNMVF